MGPKMYELLALSVTAGFLAVIAGNSADEKPWAWMVSSLMKLASIGLFAGYVGLRAAAETGPFSPALNFALTASLTALGGWHAWAFLADDGEIEEEAAGSDDDSDWF